VLVKLVPASPPQTIISDPVQIAECDSRAVGAFVMVVGFKQRVDLRTLRRIGERCASAADALSRRIGGKVETPA